MYTQWLLLVLCSVHVKFNVLTMVFSSKPSPRKQWKQQHPNYNQSDSLHKLNRPEQVILFRLRTGHNRLNAHMYNKFKVGESEMCPCNADIMTVEHLLQHCRLHDAMRRDMWPEPTLLIEVQALWQPGGAEEDSHLREDKQASPSSVRRRRRRSSMSVSETTVRKGHSSDSY